MAVAAPRRESMADVLLTLADLERIREYEEYEHLQKNKIEKEKPKAIG